MERQFKDKFNNKIKLTGKQWEHITKEHPEAEPYKDRLSEVLSKPDFSQKKQKK